MGQIIGGWDLDEFADLDYSPTNSPPADDVWGNTFDDLGSGKKTEVAPPKPISVPYVATPSGGAAGPIPSMIDPSTVGDFLRSYEPPGTSSGADRMSAWMEDPANNPPDPRWLPGALDLDPNDPSNFMQSRYRPGEFKPSGQIPTPGGYGRDTSVQAGMNADGTPVLKHPNSPPRPPTIEEKEADAYIDFYQEIKARGKPGETTQEAYNRNLKLAADMDQANRGAIRGSEPYRVAEDIVSAGANAVVSPLLWAEEKLGIEAAGEMKQQRQAQYDIAHLRDRSWGSRMVGGIGESIAEFVTLSLASGGAAGSLGLGKAAAKALKWTGIGAGIFEKSHATSYRDAIKEGKTEEEASKIALATAAIEVGVMTAFQVVGLGGAEKAMAEGLGMGMAKEAVERTTLQGLKKFAGATASELGEEEITTLLQSLAQSGEVGGWQQYAETAVQTIGTLGLLSGSQKLTNFASKVAPSREDAIKAGLGWWARTATTRKKLAKTLRDTNDAVEARMQAGVDRADAAAGRLFESVSGAVQAVQQGVMGPQAPPAGNQAATTPATQPPAQESQQVAPPVDQTAQTPQPAVAPDSPPTSAILDDLASRHPVVAEALAGPTGTPEFASIREHTAVVLDRFAKSGASTGVPELDAVLPTIIALHDIGKPAAIAKGDKSLQHKETLPKMLDVMVAEGATQQQLNFATALVGQDVIGQLMKGQISVATAAREMSGWAGLANLTPEQFLPVAQALYSADAGSYAGLSKLFDSQGRIQNYDYRALEEAVHGEVQSIPWSESYRSGGGQPAAAGDVQRTVYSHSSAVDFTRFDADKDSGQNLAGPGAYLLPPGNDAVAKIYQDRAIAKGLKTLGPNDRQRVLQAIKQKDAAAFDRWVSFAQQKQQSDPSRASDWGQVADFLAAIRDNGVKGVTLEFEFTPKKMLDLGAMASGGRVLSDAEIKSLEKAGSNLFKSKKYKGSKRGWDIYNSLVEEYGYHGANQIIQKAGFDSIGFIHGGHRARGSTRHPVVVALDHNAPVRVQPGPPPAPTGPPPTTDNLNQTQQNASGIPMDRDTRAAFTRAFISGGNQDQVTRDLVYRRDSIIRKHTAKIFQGTRDLRRAVKAARRAAGKRIWNKNTPANLTDEALNDALADPTLIPTLPLKVGVEIQKIRDHIDSLTDQIQMLGGITPDMFLVLEGNKGKYITRTFKKFEDVIGWRHFALNDPTIMADFAAEVRQTSKNATDQEIKSLAEELLRRDTLRPTGLTSTSSTQAYVNILERRKDLSPAVRQLYGENKNIFDNYAATVGQMASTIAHRGFIENLKRDALAAGTFSEAGKTRNKPDHVQQVSWDKIPQLAPLKGVLMTPEMAVALNDLYGMPGTTGFLSVLASGSSVVKGAKTIGAVPRAFIRNFFGNIPISIANGNWNIISGVKAIGETGLEYFDQQDDATKKKWERLVELGVVESFTVDELRDAAKASNAAMKSYLGMIPGARAAKATVKGAARAYQAMDTVSKIHNYQSELATLQKAYPGKPLFELEEEAAKITRALNPTYDEASKAARYWSRYVPLGSFAMFSAEIYRTTGNRMMRAAYEVREGLKTGNDALLQKGMDRMAGQAVMILLLGTAADLFQELLGTKLSPEQEKAFRDNLPPWQKHSNLIVTQVDDEGNPISYADLGYNDPFGVFPKMINALAAGESDEAALQLVEPFVTEDILAGALLSLWRGRDEQDRPMYTEGVSKERQWMERIAFLAKKAEPGTVTSLRRFKDAVQGKTTKSGAPLSVLNEVISNLGGMRIDRFDRDTAGFYRNREYEQKIKDSQTAISKAFSGKGTFDPDEARAIWHDAHAVREQSMKEWKQYMEGLRLLGEKEPFAKVVRDTTSNSLIAQQAYTGNVSPYEFTQDALGRMLKLPQGEQRLDLLRELYAEAAAGKDEPALPASPFRQ